MKKRVILVCLAVILVVALSGCSRGGELDGMWRSLHSVYTIRTDYGDAHRFNTWEFSGDRFILNFYYLRGTERIETEYEGMGGTFSIHGDQIELTVYGHGVWRVSSFSRTENTFTIDGVQYNRVS